MKTYEVTGTVKVEVAVTFTVKAKTPEEAEKKAEGVMDGLVLTWEGQAPKGVAVEWSETDQSAEVESVDEIG
jgi:hypothetical protein